ncbi:MAG: HD domain-containing phosphohydrolase [Desulfobacteria bacterium]
MSESDRSGSDHIHILVVDDEEAIRNLTQEGIKRAGYECSIARNGEEALKVLGERNVDVVITDIMMPGLNGVGLTKIIKEKYDSDIIIMTGYIEDFSYETVIGKGASDFIEKPAGVRELIVRLKRVLRERAVLAERNQAEERLQHSLEKLRRAMEGIVQAMAVTVEKRDPYTAGHQRRVANLACAIAKEMGLSADQIDGIRMAGLIHDLGKIAVPAEILSKPTRLTDIEFSLIKTHAQAGYEMLDTIDFPWPIAQMVRQHHERMDGSGYPKGLSGEDILLEARILAVADTVEAIASHRPYRPARGIDKALDEILQNKGTLYDLEVVNACLKVLSEKGFKFE